MKEGPTYYDLLDAAYEANRAVDDFDLRSENPESMKEWERLLTENREAQERLAEHVLKTYQLEERR